LLHVVDLPHKPLTALDLEEFLLVLDLVLT
jgi:hypothetical protein